MTVCQPQEQAKIKGILANYGITQDTFADKYESLKFNIERENNQMNEQEVDNLILSEMEDRLQEEHIRNGT